MNAVDEFLKKNQDVASKYLKVISSMLNDYESYGYAEDTLAGIYENIESAGRVTKSQIDAVENIKDKPRRRYG